MNKVRYKWTSRAFLLAFYDLITINFAGLIALFIRFDFKYSSIDSIYLANFIKFAPINTILIFTIYYFGKLYHSVWHLASFNEAFRIILCSTISGLLEVAGMLILGLKMPVSYFILCWIFRMGAAAAIRFSYRIARMFKNLYLDTFPENHKKVMIIGAGEAGKIIANEIKNNTETDYHISCFIDDAKVNIGKTVCGVKIVGTRASIESYAAKHNIDLIILAMPSAKASSKREILEICQRTGCEIRVAPGMYQLVNGTVNVSKLRKVNITDLLGREPITIDNSRVFESIEGQTILVTGGGGSIGSELCRQIAAHAPGHLIIFDIYENNAYDIQQELKRKYPDLQLDVLIGSVRNTHRINEVFETYKPNIVFHAAAHKHVPLMEDSPNEAIKNNVFGTFKTARAAYANNCEKFVLISTDKAVNPTNIMGASKRICEMIIQMFADKSESTKFVAVRFGNVLGSNGSVIPLFKKQIEEGGPVTVTHKDIIRYFMTIPEAVSLILQASVYAEGGEIFVLDMGEPVRIDDLARNLIRLSGYIPDVDITVEYTGLRPGEKLYEEMLMSEEGMRDTANGLIHIGNPIQMNYEVFSEQLEDLYEACKQDDNAIREKVAEIVTTYNYKKAV